MKNPPHYRVHASCSIIFVRDLDRSLDFYIRMLNCAVQISSTDAALMVTIDGFHIYLVAQGERAPHPVQTIGHHGLTWSVETADELLAFESAAKRENCYLDTHEEHGVTFVQARDPDDLRIIVAHPGPGESPRSVIPDRIRS